MVGESMLNLLRKLKRYDPASPRTTLAMMPRGTDASGQLEQFHEPDGLTQPLRRRSEVSAIERPFYWS